MAYIYQIINDINGKIYVGKTEFSIERRFKEHCDDAYKDLKEKRPLYAAMRKYGIEHFHISLLEETDNPDERECYWIEQLRSFKNGYNATMGGDGKKYLDYDLIIATYNNTNCIQETAKLCGVHRDSVQKILKVNNICIKTSQELNILRNGKTVALYNKNQEIKKIFSSLREAGRYVIKQQWTSMTDEQKVAINISRCANGKRKTAFGYNWKFI